MVYVVIVGLAVVVLALLALTGILPIGRKSTPPTPGPIAQRLAESDPADAAPAKHTEGG